MRYDNFAYLWPPRPETAIAKPMLNFYQKKNWVAQAKMNGTCNLIAVSPDKKIKAMTRHNADHKLWSPTADSSAAFQNVSGDGWWVFVAELLHSKVPGIKDTNYVHDVLVANGKHLVGKTFAERQEILQTAFLKGDETDCDTHWIVNQNTWVAKNHSSNFSDIFNVWNKPEIEGLVIKNPNAPLLACLKQSANSGWQVKIRKPTKNYSY